MSVLACASPIFPRWSKRTQNPRDRHGTPIPNPPIFFGTGIHLDEASPTTPRTRMAKILRNWNKLPISERIAFCRKIVDNQKKTPSPIAHPYPDLAAMDTDTAAAEAADLKVRDLERLLKAARAERQAASDQATGNLNPNASHVEGDTKGDAQPMIVIGYEVTGVQPAPAPGPLTQVTNLSVSSGDSEGEVDGSWDRKPGAQSYNTRYTYDVTKPDAWVAGPDSTKSKVTLTGLTSGKRVWVQVRGFGPKGAGPWSDEASKMVP